MPEKYCSGCKKWKPDEGFIKRKVGRAGHFFYKSECAECTAIKKLPAAEREAIAKRQANEARANYHMKMKE